MPSLQLTTLPKTWSSTSHSFVSMAATASTGNCYLSCDCLFCAGTKPYHCYLSSFFTVQPHHVSVTIQLSLPFWRHGYWQWMRLLLLLLLHLSNYGSQFLSWRWLSWRRTLHGVPRFHCWSKSHAACLRCFSSNCLIL